MVLNEINYGFKLVEIRELADINSKMYVFMHLKSGGMVVHLANLDDNCCFAIGFRTKPTDSTGVCHIIEHSVLCGSERFPLKEPFVNLLKSSMATFLNAFTAYDWTMYPFASQNKKDFDNILSIYLDAVFRPLSVKSNKAFLQEGWHLELLDEKAMPSYKGVVYNEMKGAMSSVEERLVQTTLEAMYKDTFYHYNSGGEPSEIPNLTYEAYKEFYHKHYNPQNALTYFYGNLDILEKLKYLDENYFSKYDKVDNLITIEAQKPIIDTNYEVDYEIGEEETEKNNTYISLCYGLDRYDNYEELLGMEILCDALLSKNDSPLKKALLEAKLGENVSARIDDDNIIPALHIYLYKSNPKQKEEFRRVFLAEVEKLVKNGIDKDLLLASINSFEFRDRELDMGSMPKGLVFAMNMMGSFNYNMDLASHLEFSKHYKKIKNELNNNYFEKLLEKYILNSKHYVLAMCKPNKKLQKQNEEKMAKKMALLKASMSKEEIKTLVKQTKELLEYQGKTDTKKELSTLPKLKLSDINKNVNFLESQKLRINGISTISHDINTNGIAYLRMYFDLNKLEEKDIIYAYLLKRLFLNVPTARNTLDGLNKLVKTYLGDLSFNVLVGGTSRNDYYAKFMVSSSALVENVNYIPEILNDVLLHSKFTKKEVMQILKQTINALRQEIIGNGMQLGGVMANRNNSKDQYLKSLISGVGLYRSLNALLASFDYKALNENLKRVSKLLFTKQNVLASISGDEESRNSLKDALKKVKLPRTLNEDKLEITLGTKINEALVIPAGVSYNAYATNLETANSEFNPRLLVLTQIVNFDYLWNEVRVKGGAYGCYISSSMNNNVFLGSYRDPNVKNTYLAYEKLFDYLNSYNASKKDLDSYIISAAASFDQPLSQPLTINASDLQFISGMTKKKKEAYKKEIMRTKPSDIKAYGEIFKKAFENGSRYTIGSKEKINEYSFDKVENL